MLTQSIVTNPSFEFAADVRAGLAWTAGAARVAAAEAARTRRRVNFMRLSHYACALRRRACRQPLQCICQPDDVALDLP